MNSWSPTFFRPDKVFDVGAGGVVAPLGVAGLVASEPLMLLKKLADWAAFGP